MDTPEDLFAITRHPAFPEFLMGQVAPQPHYLSHLQSIKHQFLDAIIMEAYHGLRFMFKDYPNLKSIRPRWEPYIDGDDEIHVRFLVDLSYTNAAGAIENGTFRYDECPEGLSKEDPGTFNLMIELGEAIYPEFWDAFNHDSLRSRKTPFVSLEDVEAQMEHEMGPFLSKFEQFALSLQTPKVAQSPPRRAL